ncbi:MAG: MBL fold metallo-hydrolase [Spirochaetaceae bacterium]|jgi:phosphoribosyl 1,2-cyclic phosphate phosphodiesterase|nr:MBL fold metallo-hydrolase [Spirochaetaceae bacterium]
MKLIVLGSGTSHGIPVVGCGCPVCRSEDPRDKRMRASLYIEGDGGERVVIDTGPEFRLQAIRAGITRLDALFLTHSHADHIHGLDDLRPLCYERPIPVYGNRQTLEELQERFSYVFKPTQQGGGKPRIILKTAQDPVRIGGLIFTPIPIKHGILDILGWKIIQAEKTKDPAVYLTDLSHIPQESLDLIREPALLIIGGLRERLHETHFTFQEALTTAWDLGAKEAYLTHICHEHSHRDIEDYCRVFQEKSGAPGIMGPAYDGQEWVLRPF